jgi:serine/threonine-protein kinase
MENTNEKLFEKFEIIKTYKKDQHSGVYLAHHIYLDKKIILKTLNTQTIPNKAIVDRFKREAKVLAKLEHKNIIKVLDFGTYHEYFYISFEYFPSENLREKIKSRKLTQSEKRKIIIQLFEGLNYAHYHNIIHRDIKPENILVSDDLHVKISDFGLAMYLDESLKTNQYSFVGTPCYMAPEQVQGEDISPKSDLFAAGIVTLELFKYRNPFLKGTLNDTINKIGNFKDSDIYNFAQSLPHDIWEVVNMLLKRNPEHRAASANDILRYFNVYVEQNNNKIKARLDKRWIILSIIIFILTVGIIWLSIAYFSEESRESSAELNGNGKPGFDSISLSHPALIEYPVKETDTAKAEKPSEKQEESESGNLTKRKTDKLNPPETGASNKEDKKVTAGQIYIECHPWADVYVDSIKVETLPMDGPLELQSGTYFLQLVHPELPNYENKISVEAGVKDTLKVNLESLYGYLECKVFPWGKIYIDDKYISESPMNNPLKLTPGNHRLKISHPDYSDLVKNIKITERDTLKFVHRFGK